MAVTKRTRYEVLRRDNNTCRYCGATAPDSPLTIDHVTPVALGGTDTPDNLVAACRDCNAGKASTSPDSKSVEAVSDDALRWAKAMQAALDTEAQDLSEQAAYREHFEETWNAWQAGGQPIPKPQDWAATLDQWGRIPVPVAIIENAVSVAMGNTSLRNSDAIWRYFCGVVWRTLDNAREAAEASLNKEDITPPAPAGNEWDLGYDAGVEQVFGRYRDWLLNSLILEAVVDGGLDIVPDAYKWSA